MKLDPRAAKERKERAAKHDRRVEVRREASGNASLSGRELPAADAMASKSHLDAVAARLRAAGHAGTLDHLRALALTELTQGRDPLSPSPQTPPGPPPPIRPPAPRQGPMPARTPMPIPTLVSATTRPPRRHPPPAPPRRSPRRSTCSSRPERCWAGPPPPDGPAAGGCWTPTTPATSSGPPHSTRQPAGASRSPGPTAPRSPTPAPKASTPGRPDHRITRIIHTHRTRPATSPRMTPDANRQAKARTPTRRRSSPTSCAP